MSESDNTENDTIDYSQHFNGDDTVFVVQFTPEQIRNVINQLSEMENPTHSIHHYNYQNAREAFSFFSVASRAAELVKDGDVELYTTDDTGGSTIITGDKVISIVFGHTVPSSPAIMDTVRTTVETQVVSEEQYQIRTPPLMTVAKTMQEQFGADFIGQFNVLFDDAEGRHEMVDNGVVLALLTGAFEEELLHDIGDWAEEVGLTSQATLSRYKNKLEDAGLISTVKVPRDIGRPRQRLLLTEEAKDMSRTEMFDRIISEL